MSTSNETEFLEQARRVFAASVTRLDADTLMRLRAARYRAVEAAGRRPAFVLKRPWALPAGAVAILFVAAVGGFLWWNQASQPAVPFATSNGDDMAIVLGNDNLDMYADMDFYRWLQAQQQAQQNPPANNGDNNNGNG